MLRSRTFRFGAAALAAAASGVGVALAAAPGDQFISGVTVTSRVPASAVYGFVGQSANVRPIGGQLDPDGPGGVAPVPIDISCPIDGVSDCSLRYDLTWPKLPSGTSNQTFTSTSVVTSTVVDAGTTTTSTATAASGVVGQAMPTADVDPFEPIDFGAVPVGSASAPQLITVTNDADADNPLFLESAVFEGYSPEFLVDSSTCENVAPGASCTVALVYRPTGTGDDELSGDLVFARAQDTVEVAVRGTGVPAAGPATVTQTQTVTTPPVTVPGPGATVTLPAQTVTVRAPAAPAVQCVVPDLKGKTQTSARRALEKASCALGTVTKPRRSTSLVVASQTVKAGSRRAAGTKVGVRLAPRAKSARVRR